MTIWPLRCVPRFAVCFISNPLDWSLGILNVRGKGFRVVALCAGPVELQIWTDRR
jgi:hypothetical protein